MKLEGDWRVRVTLPVGWAADQPTPVSAAFEVPPPPERAVTAEVYSRLPVFQSNAPGWTKGVVLRGVRTQETSAKGLLVPESLELRIQSGTETELLKLNQDYGADLEWGTIGRLPDGRIKDAQPVVATYRWGESRLDAVVRTRDGRLVLRAGEPHVAVPRPPTLAAGEVHLGNIWVPGRLRRLAPENLFPILETQYPEAPRSSPTPAESCLPNTLSKLRTGQVVRILAWGDSVTDAGYLARPERERWQGQFVARLQARFPQAALELVTEAWGGRNSASYLSEPPGSAHNYQAKVLGAKADLIVSEFVNDAGLSPEQVEERYGRLLADFQAAGAEWIILTPHYVRPDWMGLTRERDCDDDPRPYVAGLRRFAAAHGVALADGALRWGRLWRQGIPYTTLLLNAINHPDARGLKLFADSLMELFP